MRKFMCSDPLACKLDFRVLAGREFQDVEYLLIASNDVQKKKADNHICRQRQLDRYLPHVRHILTMPSVRTQKSNGMHVVDQHGRR